MVLSIEFDEPLRSDESGSHLRYPGVETLPEGVSLPTHQFDESSDRNQRPR